MGGILVLHCCCVVACCSGGRDVAVVGKADVVVGYEAGSMEEVPDTVDATVVALGAMTTVEEEVAARSMVAVVLELRPTRH